MTFQEKVMYGEWTYERLKDEVHSKSLELEEKEKQYNELSNTALQLNEMVKEKSKEIERLNNIINELEKTLLEWHEYWEYDDSYSWQYKNAYDYLQELKGE